MSISKPFFFSYRFLVYALYPVTERWVSVSPTDSELARSFLRFCWGSWWTHLSLLSEQCYSWYCFEIFDVSIITHFFWLCSHVLVLYNRSPTPEQLSSCKVPGYKLTEFSLQGLSGAACSHSGCGLQASQGLTGEGWISTCCWRDSVPGRLLNHRPELLVGWHQKACFPKPAKKAESAGRTEVMKP